MGVRWVEFSGRMYAGKDYVAKAMVGYLLDAGCSVWKTAYAWKLKELIRKHFGVTKTGFDGGVGFLKSSMSAEQGAKNCITDLREICLGLYDENPAENLRVADFDVILETIRDMHTNKIESADGARRILQNFGTEVVRNKIVPTFWVDYLAAEIEKVRDALDFVIVTDRRFHNELLDPESYLVQVQTTIETRSRRSGVSVEKLREQAAHQSEIHCDELETQYIINNEPDGGDFLPDFQKIFRGRMAI